MIHAYLCYERPDATINKVFIEQLQKAAEQRHIELTVIFPDELEQLSTDVHFVWNRSRQAHVATYFEDRSIRVFNNARTNKIANDKLLAQQFVESLQIQSIPTWQKLKDVTAYPVVLKSIDGHGGQEVVLCQDESTLKEQLQHFQLKKMIVQPYIESNAQDVRVWMLGNDVLGAVLRTGKTDFKSNYTLGGSIEKFELPPDLAEAVYSITNELRSDYIGIDFIKGIDDQFYFNEIEDPVGAKSYYDLYNDQLANRLIDYIIRTLND